MKNKTLVTIPIIVFLSQYPLLDPSLDLMKVPILYPPERNEYPQLKQAMPPYQAVGDIGAVSHHARRGSSSMA